MFSRSLFSSFGLFLVIVFMLSHVTLGEYDYYSESDNSALYNPSIETDSSDNINYRRNPRFKPTVEMDPSMKHFRRKMVARVGGAAVGIGLALTGLTQGWKDLRKKPTEDAPQPDPNSQPPPPPPAAQVAQDSDREQIYQDVNGAESLQDFDDEDVDNSTFDDESNAEIFDDENEDDVGIYEGSKQSQRFP